MYIVTAFHRFSLQGFAQCNSETLLSLQKARTCLIFYTSLCATCWIRNHNFYVTSFSIILLQQVIKTFWIVIVFLFLQLLKNRLGNDSYVERGMQTFNNGKKSKEIQSTKVELHVS